MKKGNFFGTMFIHLCLISFLFATCTNSNIAVETKNLDTNKVVYEDYDSKILPLLSFLKEHNINVANKNCSKIFVLFTNRCNTCTKSTMEEIWKDAKTDKTLAPIIIINRVDNAMLTTVKKSMNGLAHKVIIDSNTYLEKKGVTFMKNIGVTICNDKIDNWKFYY